MSTHIDAKKNEIADSILLPGDPLRAKFIAENFLDNPICYNNIRGMLGYTGTYNGKKISVQGTGMGIPSTSIYVNELIIDYGVKNLIRVGTAGAYSSNIKVRDMVIAMTSSTNSAINKIRFNGMDYSPTASFDLLYKAYNEAKSLNIDPKVGNVLTSDSFYNDNKDEWKKWAEYGVLAVEMETSALYTIASKYKANALTILTISDHLVTGEETTASQRESTFTDMIKVALNTICK